MVFGRSIFEKLQLDKKIKIIKKNHFFSRIHVEDIGNAVNQSMKKLLLEKFFNICDDVPSQSDVVVNYV